MLFGGGVDMKEFILTMLGVSLISGFASMLSPDGKEGGLRSYLGFACAICALSVTIGPVTSFITALGDSEMIENISGEPQALDYEKIYEDTLMKGEERALEEGLNLLLRTELLIDEKNIDVDVRLCNSTAGYEAELVTVRLSGKAVFTDAHRIAERVEELLFCECRVLYGGVNDKKG